MKQLALLLLLALMITGCVDRIPPLSPRRTNTEAHRQASSNQNCLSCHDVSGLRHHQPDDNCILCHKLTYGGIR